MSLPPLPWIAADQNPWGVRLLDVRPVTLGMLSTPANQQAAANAVSFGAEDGTSFIGTEAETNLLPVVQADLTYQTDEGMDLRDGVLFVPRVMEEKWALFYHSSKIIFVRSWTRTVQMVASVEMIPGEHAIRIAEIAGSCGVPHETPTLTVQLVDFLLKSHVLDIPVPVPLPRERLEDTERTALLCMSLFGKKALFAVVDEDVDNVVDDGHVNATRKILRTDSLLHIAVARGDTAAVQTYLDAGWSPNLLAGDGLALLHWALACQDSFKMMETLLAHTDADVDVPSANECATPLMNAVQDGNVEAIKFLLQRGANVDAVDKRGFTSLHRACEMGLLDAAAVLLEHGARMDIAAGEGKHTPLLLARMQKETAIVDLLESKPVANEKSPSSE